VESQKFKLGTRSSDLAMYQAHAVKAALESAHQSCEIEIVQINTSGDWRPEHGETRLSEVDGGKGLFAKEIEDAILSSYVDFGVHSLKDMPSFLPDGLVVCSVLDRANPFDAMVSEEYGSFDDLPAGASVGTSSTRRAAALLHTNPEIKIVPLRGNVPTRIDKMKNGQADAIILAAAGLNRLGLDSEIAQVFTEKQMLPAACQGIIAAEYRKDDVRTRDFLTQIIEDKVELRARAERACLQILDGSCKTPIGAYAVYDNGVLSLQSCVFSLDGKEVYHHADTASVAVDQFSSAESLGVAVGEALRQDVPARLLEA
jgi:hydroxymethylbilane synthase